MEEMEIMGFDPSQLSVFNQDETPKSKGNSLIYRTRPADVSKEVAADGVYRCRIKIVYNPFNTRLSVLEQQSYWLEDARGGFSVVSSLTNNDTSCPIFKAWKKCHFADPKKAKTDEERAALTTLWKQAAKEDDGGYGLFDKRFARYCVIQVLQDKNQPELVNKYLFWKMPKAIWEMVSSMTNPSKASGKAPVPVMDFLFGYAIDLEVKPGPGKPGEERYSRETSYSGKFTKKTMPVNNVDGSPILNDEESAILKAYVDDMEEIWDYEDPSGNAEAAEDKRKEMTAAVNAKENTKALRTIYSRVLAEIKEVCPNLVEVLGYKEWDEATTVRVQKWIDMVLAGKNPKIAAPNAAETVGTTTAPTATTTAEAPATSTATPFVESAPAESDDDLPF